MKTTLFALALSAGVFLNSQAQVDTQAASGAGPATYYVTARGPHSNTWACVTWQTNADGTVAAITNSYAELATGLNYFDSNSSQFLPSKEEVDAYPNGAAATNGQHQVLFALNPNTAGAVTMQTPDGKLLNSYVYGLSYLDNASGSNVLIAVLQDTIGTVLPPNQVLYTNAFRGSGVIADLIYTYTKSALEQDVVLRTQLPPPEAWGLSSQSTVLEVLTEFDSPPPATITTGTISSGGGGTLENDNVDFGVMKIGMGRAFVIGQDPLTGVPVAKRWISVNGTRTFLVEQVAVVAISQQLSQLPPPQQARLKPATNSPVRVASFRRVWPGPKATKPSLGSMQIAQRTSKRPGLVLDYVILNGGQANAVLQGDTTYYLSGNVNLSGTNTTFEGGAVLKYASNVTLTVSTPVTWLAGSYRPVVMTAVDDNSLGQTVSGSTGNPSNYYYAVDALYFDATTANTNLVLQNLRVDNAQTAVAINGKAGHVLSDLQAINCGNGIAATNADFALRNALFVQVMTNFTGSSATGHVEHLTVDTANWLNNNIGANLYLTNCLLVAVANTNSYVAQNVGIAASGSGVFQAAGGGAHYMADNTYRNAGTTNINAALLRDLQRRTIYPPIVLASAFGVNTTLSPQAQRDTDTPDLGWHYDPLDYVWNNLTIKPGVTLALVNGVAVGFSGVNGLTVSGTLTSLGTPLALNRLAPCAAVQEQQATALSTVIGNNGTWTGLNLRFTDLPALGGVGTYLSLNDSSVTINAGPVAVQDCLLRGGQMNIVLGLHGSADGSSYSSLSATFTNNFLDRAQTSFMRAYQLPSYLQVNIQNNLLHGGSLSLTYDIGNYYSNDPPQTVLSWPVYENLFEGVSLSEGGGGNLNGNGAPWYAFVTNGYNGYMTNAAQLQNSAGGDKVLRVADYQIGPLGNYYYPTNGLSGGLTNLIHAGSHAAAAVGLYHYTVFTNQVVEGTNIVSIGFHYVALDAYGNPLDSNGDGIPDYLEDANGNGLVDSGEIGWNITGDLGLKVIITRPRNGAILLP